MNIRKHAFIFAIILFIVNIVNAQSPVYEWARKTGSGVGGNDEGKTIKIDSLGNSIIAGVFKGVLDVDPSINTFNLVSYNTTTDFFIAKYSSTGTLSWAIGIGGNTNEQLNAMSIDTIGNVYVTGTFSGTTDFDPSPQVYNLTSTGSEIFMAKYDLNGNFVWANKIGAGSFVSVSNAITLDINCNFIVTGKFSGPVDFDPSASTLSISSFSGSIDAFLAKYNSNGNIIWAKKFGRVNTEIGNSLVTDNNSNIFLTGTFTGTSNLNPVSPGFTVSSTGADDIFISKFDALGNFLWGKVFGGTNSEIPNSITLDYNTNILLTGLYYGSGDYDPSVAVNTLPWVGSSDAFIAKYDSLGNYVWAKPIGGNYSESGKSVISDYSGNVYFTGFFQGTVDFDPSPGIANMVSISQTKDIFITKFNSSGNYQWAKRMGNDADEEGNCIVLDTSAHIALTGYFNKTVDFDPSIATYTLTTFDAVSNWTNYSFYVAKYLVTTGSFYKAFSSTDDFGGNDEGYAVKKDNAGNIFVCGYFQGAMDIDPSPATYYLKTHGFEDAFLAKYSSSGALLWAKNFGGKVSDLATAITLDNSGNVYVTGAFSDTCNFDLANPTATLVSIGASDIFVAKYNTNGNYQWALSMGSTTNDKGTAITFDYANNICVGGYYSGTIDLDPSPSVLNTLCAGARDIFLTKLDLNGNFIFSKAMGGSGDDIVNCATVDNFGNVILTGYFENWADFDPGSNLVSLTSSGLQDIFISKYDANGQFIWAKKMGAANTDVSSCVKVDSNNNYLITGTFMSTVDFDPSIVTNNLNAAGGSDGFIAKYNQAGAYLWAKNTIEGSGDCTSRSLDFDAAGNIYTTGAFTGFSDFNPGFPTYYLNSTIGDMFIAKYDSTCNFLWAIKNAGTNGEQGNSILVDNSNNIYTTGFFTGEVDFDASYFASVQASAGAEDVFLLKYKQCTALTLNSSSINPSCYGNNNGSATITPSGGSSFSYSWSPINSTSPSIYNLSAGNYSCIVSNSCGASNTLNISITQPSSLTAYMSQNSNTVCSGNYFWFNSNVTGGTGSYTYSWSTGYTGSNLSVYPTQSSVYTLTIADANNCSKTLTASVNVVNNPTINVSASSTLVCAGSSLSINAFGSTSYSWNTGSTSPNIVVSPLVPTTYTVTGFSNSCSNTASVFINVNPMPNLYITSSSSIICIGATATINVSGASSYTWDSGSNNTSIVVSPIVNTTYTVSGENTFGCINIATYSQNVSYCTAVDKKEKTVSTIYVYPNPNNGEFFISEFENNTGKDIEILNSLGQLIKQYKLENENQAFSIREFPNGFYFIRIRDKNLTLSITKFIKN